MVRGRKCRAITEGARLILILVLVATLGPTSVWGADAAAVSASTLGIIININDPQSVAVGDYYQKRRGVPVSNVIRVRLPAGTNTISEQEFTAAKTQIDKQTPVAVQAYVLTWSRPYRVECMSITTAVASGFSRDFCSKGCQATRVSSYFDSATTQPMLDLGIRPTMMLAVTTVQQAHRLIDRGIAADTSSRNGVAYLATTADVQRNVRSARYGLVRMMLSDSLPIRYVNGYLSHADDVMFYFIGAVNVPDLTTNSFLPGAVGDHLTSAGGALLDTNQMSSLRWLEAGATGSYGTVVEPCNYPGKFPDPLIMMKHYLAGETLLEAYWKSVQMPGQGLFIGEPLARPFAQRMKY
jgi:uncharacterized protein (TIGR03790 family)